MNRLTNPFSSVAPLNSSSDTASIKESPRVPSPLEPHFMIPPRDLDRDAKRDRSHSPATRSVYDDPRQIYYESAFSRWETQFQARRPGLLRHVTDDGLSRGPSPAPTLRVRDERSRERDRKNARNNTVVTNLMAGRKGAGRFSAMAKGPDDKYAVGGGMALRIVQIRYPTSGASTPMPDSPARKQAQNAQVLGKGPGGTTITDVVNLWRTSMAVGKGINDITWGVGSYSSKIVTAAPSGNFLIFDLNRGRLERDIPGGNTRPLNSVKLAQVPSHCHLLLTGGAEGHAKIWDLRDRDPVNKRYFKHSAIITSLSFSPDDPHQFVVGLDNGAIQRYDLRHHRHGRVWGAHGSKAVMDLKWKVDGEHEIGGGWLASAGADRTVQIWDMSQTWAEKAPTPLHVLHTAYPLRRVSWRPDHPTDLAIIPLNQPIVSGSIDPSVASIPQGLGQDPSSGIEDDAHIEVWDVRRHYIPKYGFPTGQGTAIDAIWADDSSLVTTFQNGGFGQYDLRNKTIALDRIPRQVMGWSARGEVAFALDRFKQGEIPFDDIKLDYINHWDKIGRRTKSIADPAYEPVQAVGFASLNDTDEEEFIYLANHYRIDGDAPENLCQWNAEVATICGREDDARLWLMLGGFIKDFSPSSDGAFNEDIFHHGVEALASSTPTPQSPKADASLNNSLPNAISLNDPHPLPEPIPLRRVDPDTSDDAVEELLDSNSSASSSGTSDSGSSPARGRFVTFLPPKSRAASEARDLRASVSTIVPTKSSSGGPGSAAARSSKASGSKSRSSESSDEAYPDPYGIIPDKGQSQSQTPVTYGVSRSSMRSSPIPTDSRNGSIMRPSPVLQASQGPGQAKKRSSSLSNKPFGPGDQYNAFKKDSLRSHPFTDVMETNAREDYRKRRTEHVLRWWNSYVEDGDVQFATVFQVVASCVLDLHAKQAERIAHAYLEHLDRLQLSIPAAYIRLHAQQSSMETLPSDTGITHISFCDRCGKATGSLEDIGEEKKGKRFWWCKSCRLHAKRCGVCREGVKGLWWECKRCKHGGHQLCMRAYYTSTPPTFPATDDRDAVGSLALPLAHLTRLDSATSTVASQDNGPSGVTERSRTSAEIAPSDRRSREIGWVACPTGCECKCRTVVIDHEAEHDLT